MAKLTEKQVMDIVAECRAFLAGKKVPIPKECRGKVLLSWDNKIYKWVEVAGVRYLSCIFTLYAADTKEEAEKIIKKIKEESYYLRQLEVVSWKHQDLTSPTGGE